MTQKLPDDWDEDQIRRIIDHYDNQTEEEAIAEAEAAYERSDSAMIQVPNELIPEILELIQQYRSRKAS
ncbi:MAG: hypothetical protein GEU75_15045 [Dehalococcoidia bacterium]|nr:hypothetical protein [Dehalococcoidia bacterium]